MRKLGIKKQAAKMLALIMVIPLMACQATPDVAVVGNKDQNNMIDKATQSGGVTGTVKERTKAPENFKTTAKTDGKMSVESDAKVVVPNVNKVPIKRVDAANFSAEQVKAYFDYLCKGVDMYNEKAEMTKAEVEEQILWIQKLIADDKSSDDSYKKSLKQELDKLKEQHKTAPETVPDVKADGLLQTKEVKHPKTNEVLGKYENVSAMEKMEEGKYGKSFYASNNSDIKESIVIEEDADDGMSMSSGIPKYTGAYLSYNDPENSYYNMEGSEEVTEDYVPDVRVGKNLTMTAAAAKKLVQDMLDATKTPMEITDIRVLKSERYENTESGNNETQIMPMPGVGSSTGSSVIAPEQNKGEKPKSKTYYAYQFTCKRKVDNISCAEVEGSSFAGGSNEGDDINYGMREFWNYEQYQVRVTDKGIIGVNWSSPLTIKDTVVEDSSLKSFEDIQAVFDKMMAVKYEFATKDDFIEKVKYKVSKVELELMRVAEQNSIETGLLIPVWRFYGVSETTYKQQEGEKGDQYVYKVPTCLLTLNAIDGSLIDETKGY